MWANTCRILQKSEVVPRTLGYMKFNSRALSTLRLFTFYTEKLFSQRFVQVGIKKSLIMSVKRSDCPFTPIKLSKAASSTQTELQDGGEELQMISVFLLRNLIQLCEQSRVLLFADRSFSMDSNVCRDIDSLKETSTLEANGRLIVGNIAVFQITVESPAMRYQF